MNDYEWAGNQMQGQQSLRILEASISATRRDLRRAPSAAISASTRDLLKAFSVAILSAATSASILDLLNALSVAILSASISAATLDLLRAASVATSASILDLLRALSVAIYASILDLLRAASVAAREAARSAARRDLLRADSTSREAAQLSGGRSTCSRGSSRGSRTSNKFMAEQLYCSNNFYGYLYCQSYRSIKDHLLKTVYGSCISQTVYQRLLLKTVIKECVSQTVYLQSQDNHNCSRQSVLALELPSDGLFSLLQLTYHSSLPVGILGLPLLDSHLPKDRVYNHPLHLHQGSRLLLLQQVYLPVLLPPPDELPGLPTVLHRLDHVLAEVAERNVLNDSVVGLHHHHQEGPSEAGLLPGVLQNLNDQLRLSLLLGELPEPVDELGSSGNVDDHPADKLGLEEVEVVVAVVQKGHLALPHYEASSIDDAEEKALGLKHQPHIFVGLLQSQPPHELLRQLGNVNQ